MSWGLGLSIIGVIAAGILAGLLISYIILKNKKKHSSPIEKNEMLAFSVAHESRRNFATEQQIVNTPKIKIKPVISMDEKVEAYLGKLNNSHPAASNPSETRKSDALIELENNLSIAKRPVTNTLVNFHTNIWNNKRGEFNILTSEIRSELTEAYVDMLLANNIVWLVTELGRNSQDLIDGYYKLSNKVAERLQRIMPSIRNSFE